MNMPNGYLYFKLNNKLRQNKVVKAKSGNMRSVNSDEDEDNDLGGVDDQQFATLSAVELQALLEQDRGKISFI